MNQKEFDNLVDEHNELVLESENKLVKIALENNLKLELGAAYGEGRMLLLEDDNKDWGSGKKRGEWLYSSESC
jgi:hypothetical protein